MFKKAQPFFIICESPLHAGAGSDIGIIDLPIQRERHTQFPKIEGSSLKGPIRQAFEENARTKDNVHIVFGPDNSGGGEMHGGALSISDARLLLFPVKSVKGVFAWITCPAVIDKLVRDLALCGITPEFTTPLEGAVPYNPGILVNGTVILEDSAISVNVDADANGACTKFAKWIEKKAFPEDDIYVSWKKLIYTNLVVVPDEAFCDFVTQSTEVVTRNVINNKTGISKNLFIVEYLPTESVLYSLALTEPLACDDAKKGGFAADASNIKITVGDQEAEKVMAFFTDNLPEILQIGGDKTVGKGIVRIQKWRQR